MKQESITLYQESDLKNKIDGAWDIIPPNFPIENFVAVNPLKGLEHMPFSEAIKVGNNYFQTETFLSDIDLINRETIKWCQAYFDDEQSKIQMPLKELGFYQAFKKLATFDKKLSVNKKNCILTLPKNSFDAIDFCLRKLNVTSNQTDWILRTLLCTLPGWSSYIKYKTSWDFPNMHKNKLLEYDYLAIRLALSIAFLKDKNEISIWRKNKDNKNLIKEIEKNEIKYYSKLVRKLYHIKKEQKKLIHPPKAQFIFCIDTRSEPFRRAIEAEGNYETFGFAGFFGVPICIETFDSNKHNSCPVLLKPIHTIKETIGCQEISEYKKNISKIGKISLLKKIYQSLKYNFTTPFLLAEFLGVFSFIWMILKTFFPEIAFFIKNKLNPEQTTSLQMSEICILEGIPFLNQVDYAENMLRSIDLVHNFSPIILLCGHGSSTQNNAYGSSLDCGACGGHDGSPNARVMSTILNTDAVRNQLKTRGINIPVDTQFIPALHNTTTDEITLLSQNHYPNLENDLKKVQLKNKIQRSKKELSTDWAQTRPEWGLAKNAAFIVGPRQYTSKLDLEGRCFLHSYNWEKDEDLSILNGILTAPMIVAQWINCQYLFSTLDPITYGAGNKITQNITGKIGIMQGNASDLMHGLPLQSTHLSDHEKFHEPMRLMTIIYAPRNYITKILFKNSILKKLATNEWVKFSCIDPYDNNVYQLKTDLNWEVYEHIQ